jgi:hypothetical protein
LGAPGFLEIRVGVDTSLEDDGKQTSHSTHTPDEFTLTLPRLSELFSRGAMALVRTTQTHEVPGDIHRPISDAVRGLPRH